MTEHNPEIGASVDVDGIATNYHRRGCGDPVLLVHGSGPGVRVGQLAAGAARAGRTP